MAEPTRDQIAQDYAKALAIIDGLRTSNAELLAALQVTLNYWTGTGFADCEPDCDCIVESVRAAIANATGQPAPTNAVDPHAQRSGNPSTRAKDKQVIVISHVEQTIADAERSDR